MTRADEIFRKGMESFKNGDYKTAANFLGPLAQQGHANAQNYIGVMYEWGRVFRKNTQKAINWYRKAATQGNISGQFNLGFCYEYGIGVRKNQTQAIRWYQKAADQGCPEAQWCLSRKYQHGEGVKRDLIEAYKWYILAAKGAGLIKKVNSRLEMPPAVYLARQMTAKQIVKAKKHAAAWKSSPYSHGR